MYINFWYPVCLTTELDESNPVRARILEQQFVAFRDGEGVAHVLSDTCAHRGGSLSKGTVSDPDVFLLCLLKTMSLTAGSRGISTRSMRPFLS